VAVGLVAGLGVQHPHPCRKLRGNIEHGLARGDQLLREQQPEPGSAFDGPGPRRERRGERQQPFSLATIRPDTNLAEHLLVAVDDRRMMRSLVGIDSNDEDVKPPRPSR
jgi:hypothetical protein